MKAKIVKENEGLALCINGERIAPAAYMSYLENNADYEGFKKAGYGLFCACVYMGDGPINENSGVHTFGEHVWKSHGVYDFTPVYNSVKRVVGDGKKRAYVMLRVNLNAPRWWREENPDELLVLSDGIKNPYMQSEHSQKWQAAAKVFLDKLCEYLKTFEFSENVIAIQIAGMQTEEWLSVRNATGCFDYSDPAKKAYALWLENKRKKSFDAHLPTSDELQEARHGDKITDREKYANLIEYMRFFNEVRAQVIAELCAYVKKITKGDLLVGVFYGYIGQLPCEFGHNGVSKLLYDENIDFFASPFAYIDGRKTAKDWIYHGAMDSATLAGKIWFLEMDIRTCYTKALYETNPELMDGERTVKHFQNPTWFGPKTERESVWHMLRAVAKVLCSGHAFWWFDMWGGWYDSPELMKLVEYLRLIYERNFGEGKNSQLAVILDEETSYGLSEEYYCELSVEQLVELGFVGAPYDIYHIHDEEKIKGRYKALLYIAPTRENAKGNLLVFGEERTEKKGRFTAEEIRTVLQKAGGHVWSEGNIVYANERFVCLTATRTGEVKLTLPRTCKLQAFTDGKIYEGKEFVFSLEYNQTELFKIIG